MEIILKFDGVEEKDEAREALDGSKWKLAMWDLDQELRNIVRNDTYKNREPTPEEYAMAEDFRNKIREILEHYNLNLD